MKKYRYFVNIDKEEAFLHKMIECGYYLESVSSNFVYNFTKKDIHKEVKIDYRLQMDDESYNDYITLLKDYGWELISGNKDSRKHYFISTKNSNDDSLFSTEESRYNRYKLMRNTYSTSATTAMILYVATHKDSQLTDAWFSTELFNLKGIEFVKSFALELPIVLLKLIPALIVPLAFVWFTFLTFKARQIYKKASV